MTLYFQYININATTNEFSKYEINSKNFLSILSYFGFKNPVYYWISHYFDIYTSIQENGLENTLSFAKEKLKEIADMTEKNESSFLYVPEARYIFLNPTTDIPIKYTEEIIKYVNKINLELSTSEKEVLFNKIIMKSNDEDTLDIILNSGYNKLPLVVINKDLDLQTRKIIIKKFYRKKDLYKYTEVLSENATDYLDIDNFIEATIIENNRIQNKNEAIVDTIGRILIGKSAIPSYKKRDNAEKFFKKYHNIFTLKNLLTFYSFGRYSEKNDNISKYFNEFLIYYSENELIKQLYQIPNMWRNVVYPKIDSYLKNYIAPNNFSEENKEKIFIFRYRTVSSIMDIFNAISYEKISGYVNPILKIIEDKSENVFFNFNSYWSETDIPYIVRDLLKTPNEFFKIPLKLWESILKHDSKSIQVRTFCLNMQRYKNYNKCIEDADYGCCLAFNTVLENIQKAINAGIYNEDEIKSFGKTFVEVLSNEGLESECLENIKVLDITAFERNCRRSISAFSSFKDAVEKSINNLINLGKMFEKFNTEGLETTIDKLEAFKDTINLYLTL